MEEQQKWQWQEPGRAWRGVGLYHITLTIPDRRPLLGTLDIPEGDPTMTTVRRTPQGHCDGVAIHLTARKAGDAGINQ